MLDRSFSSLSAVAQRLLGRWTKWAIWGFTGWEADVASDYLACRCYKASPVRGSPLNRGWISVWELSVLRTGGGGGGGLCGLKEERCVA